MGTSWGLLGTLGDSSGTLGDHLETFGEVLGYLGHVLAIPWGHLPVLLDASGASWGIFGGNLELQGALVGSQRGSRRSLGSILEASKVFTKQFAAICKNLQIYCNVLQKSMSGEIEIVEKQFQKH